MAWTLEGTYFENCSCDAICPCTWSGLTARATHDTCKAMLAFHIDRGDIEGVEVGGLNFALVWETPAHMLDGGWRLGVVIDSNADDNQTAALGRVLSGDLGGPPAIVGPLIGEMLGVEHASVDWRAENGTFAVRFGELIDVEVASFVAGDNPEPVRLANVFHPSNSTLVVSPATRARVDAFGISWDGTGTSGFNAPYVWAA